MHLPGNLTFCAQFIAASVIAMTLSCGGGCASTPGNDPIQTPAVTEDTVREAPADKADAPDEAPLPDVTVEPKEERLLRLAVVADMNGSYGTDLYDAEVVKGIDMIIEDKPDIVINAGDMVAGQKPKLDYRKMWKGFHANVTQRLLDAGILMAQAPGNHDASAYPKYAKEREIYIDEWNQRKPALDYVDDSPYPLSYSFMLKGVFFVALDATTLDPLPDETYDWLEKQLANNPSKYRPVVFFHVPLFPITTIKPTEILRDDRLPPLFEKYHVQLVLTGHQQAYFPAKLNGVTYVHSGALGGGPRPVRQNNGIAPKTLTFVNIYPNSEPYIDTRLIAGGKGEHFNHNLLPTYIVFGNKILPRADVSLEDAEFARDYMISPHMTKSQMDALIKALRANGGDWGRIPDWKADK
ncbi:MAG: metallophosphoesterase [Proteobacteria bacterium]|nr:metallophosphoesterase [Pseudomonadota bacterium]